MWLKKALVEDTTAIVDEIFYLNWEAVRRFNKVRGEQPMVFSGWYWAKGANEGGPFKSKSSAYRDAWYRLVLKRAPPNVHRQGRRRLKLVKAA